MLKIMWYSSAPLTYLVVGYMILCGNVAIKKTAFDEIGGFDASILFYGDDTDTARRLKARGGDVEFHMGFTVGSSARRFKHQGFLKTAYLYAANFLSEVIYHKPYSS